MNIDNSRDWFCAMGAAGCAIFAVVATINELDAAVAWGSLIISVMLFLEVSRP